jgi:ParB family chromosome partitioning protein
MLDINDVYPNPDQPRKIFDQGKLEELGESIKEHGLLQPVKVRPDGNGKYMLVLGERRWRASVLIGAAKIAATVCSMSDDDLADAAIVENLQRADISPLEEAKAYQARLDTGISVEDLAKRLGIKQPWRITERTSLLKLAPEFQDAFAKSIITPSQATELARLDHNYQRVLGRAITSGRCKSYAELRALSMSLFSAQERQESATFKLSAHDANEQPSLFASFREPSPEERAVVTRMEKKIEQVAELLQGGFKDNEIVITRKVSAAKADTIADQLDLIEGQLRKLRLALRASAAESAARAA